MNKIRFEFEFTYFMGESTEEENVEDAKYNIDVNSVKLLKPEIENVLVYINDYLKKEIGHYITNNMYEKNEYIVNIKTDQVDAENIINLLDKFNTKLKLLFKEAKVEELVQIGTNHLAHNTKKMKI